MWFHCNILRACFQQNMRDKVKKFSSKKSQNCRAESCFSCGKNNTKKEGGSGEQKNRTAFRDAENNIKKERTESEQGPVTPRPKPTWFTKALIIYIDK